MGVWCSKSVRAVHRTAQVPARPSSPPAHESWSASDWPCRSRCGSCRCETSRSVRPGPPVSCLWLHEVRGCGCRKRAGGKWPPEDCADGTLIHTHTNSHMCRRSLGADSRLLIAASSACLFAGCATAPPPMRVTARTSATVLARDVRDHQSVDGSLTSQRFPGRALAAHPQRGLCRREARLVRRHERSRQRIVHGDRAVPGALRRADGHLRRQRVLPARQHRACSVSGPGQRRGDLQGRQSAGRVAGDRAARQFSGSGLLATAGSGKVSVTKGSAGAYRSVSSSTAAQKTPW